MILLNNNLTSAYMRGRLLLPITDTTPQNALAYKALFNNVAKSFDFSLTPTTPSTSNSLRCQAYASAIIITLDDDRKESEEVLHGLEWRSRI
ncbi:MAG: hypothetical protein IPM83_11740 [Ignavibacteria bacterium]|nr:hypothetical protein [Ignavibacteria bacterium]